MFLVNGEISDCLPVTDRGLQYGDGVFETMAISRKKILCWEQHYQRLVIGCRHLNIIPPPDDLLLQEAKRLIAGDQVAVLKLIVTRGTGGRGYRAPDPAPPPTRVLGLYPWPDYPVSYATEGITLRLCKTHLSRNRLLAGIKHLNRLEQVLARNEWQDAAIAEGLMLDSENNVIAGTMSNLFLVNGEKLLTPALDQCGVNGIVRQAVLDYAGKLSLACDISPVSRDELLQADALFVTNSIFGVWPVRQLESRSYTDHNVAHRIRQALASDGMIVS